jgi:hypothetical protein
MAAFDKKQMDAIVSRFLAWKLPKTFSPDCWISFNLPKENFDKPGFWPVGTNLLTADEARAMLEHILPPMPKNGYTTEAEGDAYTHGWFDGNEAPPYGKPHIAEHLFIEQRGDGKWLVCVDKVHDRMEQAQAACREWIAATGGVEPSDPVPSLESSVKLPLHQAVQWNGAVQCAEREPHKPVVLDGRTVLAVHAKLTAGVLVPDHQTVSQDTPMDPGKDAP